MQRKAVCILHPLPRTPWPFSKIYGGFDWKLSKFMHADEVAAKELLPGPYFTGKTPKRVIMLSPSLDLSLTRHLREFKRITAGLIQVRVYFEHTGLLLTLSETLGLLDCWKLTD